MATTNEISVVINDEAMTNIKAGIKLISDNLPKLITLSPEQRQALPKMGDKTISFVSKSLEYAKQNPDIVPKYFNIDELAKDVELVNALFQVSASMEKLVEGIDDTMLLAGSEAYTASLVFYSALKAALEAGQIGLKNIYEDLSARFPAKNTKKVKQ